MKKTFLLIFVLNINLFAINIAIASNTSYVIKDLIKAFNSHYPKTEVRVILGSSGQLTTQIKNGAPYGLFMSANMKYTDILYKDGLALKKPVIYAQGGLILFTTKRQKNFKDINILTIPKIKRVAIANPKTAPYGEASIEALKNAKIYKKIKSKLIYAQSLSQTLSYTMIATDIGIVAKSSLYSKKMKRYKKDINWIEINPKLYTPINQGIVLLKKDKAYQNFYNFILSKEAKKIFRNYGYITE